ncbi:MAG: hypothetical protein WCO63_10165 [Bacteroidota bacterium]
MIEYIYLCVLSIVPEKAILGRWEVACTLLSAYFMMFCLAVALWVLHYIEVSNKSEILLFITIISAAFPYFSSRRYFLHDPVYSRLKVKFETKSLGLLRLFGVLYLIGCFCVFILTAVILSKMGRY